jgi:hypothetical protein
MRAPASPQAFSKGTSLGIVLIGTLAFIAVLYWLGTGGGAANNGGGHAAGRVGYDRRGPGRVLARGPALPAARSRGGRPGAQHCRH